MAVNFIFAMDAVGAIGKNNDLPWYLPADLQYFKNVTTHQIVVMGRKTFDSLPVRPLPKRINVVLTRDLGFKAPTGTIVYHDVHQLFNELGHLEMYIIGGREIFETLMPRADRLLVTHIHHTFDADTYLRIDWGVWLEVERYQGKVDALNHYPHSWAIYERRK